MLYSPTIDLALRVAAVAHATQVRKGTALPYLAHPVHVARLLERAGLPDQVVAAGVLHDVLEDLEAEDEATRARFRAVFPALSASPDDPEQFRDALSHFLFARFGEETMSLVEAVTERKEEGGQQRPWIDRKREAIAHLAEAPADVVALKAADVLHNVQSILQDLDAHGVGVMRRFNAGPSETLWYYDRVSRVCVARMDGPSRRLAEELDAAVDALAEALGLTRPR